MLFLDLQELLHFWWRHWKRFSRSNGNFCISDGGAGNAFPGLMGIPAFLMEALSTDVPGAALSHL